MPKQKREQEPRPRGKLATSHRLTAEALELIDWLAGHLGVSKSAVLELAVRRLAASERRRGAD